MTLHIVKLSVGTDSVEDLAQWQKGRRAFNKENSGHAENFHTTRMVPKRQDDVLDGGSIYWVIKGVIQCRQRIIGFRDATRADGTRCCQILLDPELHLVRPTPRRAFQGWRYLEADDAPADLDTVMAGRIERIPPEMRRQLAELCLI
jgi:hypothetical protein